MFFKGAIRSRTKGRRTAIFVGKVAAILSVPVIMYSFGTNPPLGHSGAPGDGTCSSCHGSLTSGSGITISGQNTYTPGGAAVTMTVSIPATGGFELTALASSTNSPAGTLAAGPPPAGALFAQDAESTSGANQYVYSTVETTSWTFLWTPPATNIGNVVVYATGGTYGANYSNTFTITPAVTTPPPPPTPTLTAMPTSLTFTVNGAEPPTQTVSVTSGGSPIAVTTSATTTPSASWLTVIPPGGNTPVTATVGIVATGLAAGTYNGSVSFAAAGASNSPLSVPVTLTVTTPIPTAGPPALNLSSTGLNFTATVGGTATPQNVMVTTSDGSAVSFSATPATTSGGSWLSVGALTNTPDSAQISVTLPSGMTAGTYHGTVAFTSSAVSNSPVTLPVTLTVNSSTPPPPTTGGETFSLVVVDRQSGGTDWMLLDGTGSISSSGTLTGSGFFTRFRSMSGREGSGSTTAIVSSGTWKPTSMTSYTPISGSTTGGTMVMQVQMSTHGTTATSIGTLTITSTGSSAGVTLAINGGATFTSVGIGTESITHASTGGGGGGTGGTGTGGTGTGTDN
jgi:hypothetical protein